MVKLSRAFIILVLFVFLSCDDAYFPEGLYGYQVERLLSSGSSKTWLNQTNSSDCDEMPWALMFVAGNDSVRVNILEPVCESGDYDTLSIGSAYVSRSELIFTDSLIFSNDNVWLIQDIRTDRLRLNQGDSSVFYFPF